MSDQEKKEFIQQAYEKLKLSYERFKKPDGKQDYPAKTCRDLAVAHPDFQNGINLNVQNGLCGVLSLCPSLPQIIFYYYCFDSGVYFIPSVG